MRLPPLALPLAVLVTLTACVPAPNQSRQEGTVAPTDAPLFASDAEALAAAEEVYREYLRVSSEIDTSAGVDDLAPFVTATWLSNERKSRDDFESRGVHTEGQAGVRWVELQSREADAVSVYVCLDLATTRLVDVDGVDVTPNDRGSEGLLLVRLKAPDQHLLVDWSELWSKHCS